MLKQADISDVAGLEDIGTVFAFVKVRQNTQNVSLNLLYAMAAGLQNRDWRDLNSREKGELVREVSDLEELMSGRPKRGHR
jgi:hypothetical protein